MAFGKKIIQQIELQGEQVKREFQAIRAEGVAAFADIRKAGAGADLSAVENNAKRAGAAYGQFGRRVAATTTQTVAAGRSFGDILRSLRGFSDANDQAAGSINNTNNAAVRFGSTLRLLGRAAGIREVSKLGRDIGILGRAFAVAAPFLFVAGIAAVANVSANAAAKVGELAAESKRTTDEFQALSSAEVAVGGGVDDAAKGFKGLNDLIKDTAQNTQQHEDKLRGLAKQMAESKDKAFELSRGFDDIKRTSNKAFADIARGLRESNISFAQSLRKIQQERADILSGQPISEEEQKRRKLADLDEQEANLRRKHAEEQRKAEEDLQEAKRKQAEETRKLNRELDEEAKKQKEIKDEVARAALEHERNATALDKLGIVATNTSGKLRQAPEVLNQIADGLQNLGPGIERDRVEFDLIAAGLDRRLLPALRQGAEGLQRLSEEGARIRPPFTPEQIKQADDFKIAMGRAGEAVMSLVDEIGRLAQPSVTAFLNSFTDWVVRNKPNIVVFAQVIGGILGEAFKLIGNIWTQIIVPAFEVIQGAIKLAIDGWKALGEAGPAAAKLLQDGWQAFSTWFAGTWLGAVVGAIKEAIGWFKSLGKAKGDATGDSGGDAGAVSGFSGGGRIYGPGTPTSDSIPAYLSKDEFVHKAKAARYYGYNVMRAINEMRIPRQVFRMRGFRAGGPVRMPTMSARTPLRLAKGGPASTSSQMRPLVLDFGALGRIEGLLSPESVSNKLMQMNPVKLAKSGGRKPSSYGSR